MKRKRNKKLLSIDERRVHRKGARDARYHPDKDYFRIVSVPNGLWQAQRKLGGAGGTRESDPWMPIGRALDRELAYDRMSRVAGVKVEETTQIVRAA